MHLLAPPSQEQHQKGSKSKGIKLTVRKLVIEKGRVHVRIAKVGDKPYALDLPRVELTDIGEHGGTTPAEIARVVATSLAEETAKAVARAQGERLLRKGAEDLINKYLSM